jgi:isoleucyl-tRNA synthetase
MIRATWQWFADVTNIREEAIKVIKSVTMIPDTGMMMLTNLLKQPISNIYY